MQRHGGIAHRQRAMGRLSLANSTWAIKVLETEDQPAALPAILVGSGQSVQICAATMSALGH